MRHVSPPGVDRRAALALLAAAVIRPSPASAEGRLARRVVALNWGVSETLYAMGIGPCGAAEIPGYERMVGTPPTPPGVMDVGLQGAPNMEALAALAPRLILIQAWQQHLRPRLERCAPVESLTIFTGTGDAYAHAADATRRMGILLDSLECGAALIAACDASLAACRSRLDAYDGRPLYLAQIIDRNVVSLFSAGGLYQSVLDRLGLQNAWRGAPNLLWGGTRVGIERLAQDPEARLVLIGPAASVQAASLSQSEIWRLLPAVKAGRVLKIEGVWAFGALPSATRFAVKLTEALAPEAHG